MSAGVKHRVQFHVEDATTTAYPENFYDVVYSRDTILHIKDKLALFKLFHKSLRPGGKLLISDYCKGDKAQLGQDFQEYVKQRGYNLLTVPEYGETLEEAGFANVEAVDNTEYFIEILNKELELFRPKKSEMEREYTLKDYDDIVSGWEEKVVRCGKGDQVWGLFVAEKLYE